MEGIDAVGKKLKLTLLDQPVTPSESPNVGTSVKLPDVKTSDHRDVKESVPAAAFRHKTTLYLTARQYEILEQIYTRRKLAGKRCDRYSLVGEAIEKVYLPELEMWREERTELRTDSPSVASTMLEV